VESLARGINGVPSVAERKSNGTLRWRSLPFTTLCVTYRYGVVAMVTSQSPTKVQINGNNAMLEPAGYERSTLQSAARTTPCSGSPAAYLRLRVPRPVVLV
jgi:hypothetical protein